LLPLLGTVIKYAAIRTGGRLPSINRGGRPAYGRLLAMSRENIDA